MQTVSWLGKQETGEPLRPRPPKFGNSLPSLLHRVTDHLFTEENIPDQITGSYFDDYDILHVHDVILCKLDREKNELQKLEQDRRAIEERLKQQLKIIERNALKRELEDLNARIQATENEDKKKGYLEETKELLDEYRKLGPVIKVKSFLEEAVDAKGEENTADDDYRLKIIGKYLAIAKKYTSINVVRIIPNSRKCPYCRIDLIQVNPDDTTLERCAECGHEQQMFHGISQLRNAATSKTSGSDYEDEENFVRQLECLLGEQPAPPDTVVEDLDKWTIRYGLPPKEDIRKMALNSDGTRAIYGKDILLTGLAATGHADHYKDWKLLGRLLWNWELPTLTQQQKDMIIQDYRNTQVVFNSIRKTRSSSMNTQLRIYRHYEARGIPCNRSDFKIPTTPSILEEQDAYWKEMVKVIPGAIYRSLK